MLLYLTLLFTVGTAFADNDCSVCADAKPIDGIDWNTFFSGEWYEYYRYENKWEFGMKCVDLTFDQENRKFNVTGVNNKKMYSFGGYYVHHNDKGIVIVCSDILFENTGAACLKMYIINLKFLESALIYSCRQDKNTGHIQEYAWGFTRKPNLEGDTKVRVEKSFNSTSFIQPSKFVFPDHSEEVCCTD